MSHEHTPPGARAQGGRPLERNRRLDYEPRALVHLLTLDKQSLDIEMRRCNAPSVDWTGGLAGDCSLRAAFSDLDIFGRAPWLPDDARIRSGGTRRCKAPAWLRARSRRCCRPAPRSGTFSSPREKNVTTGIDSSFSSRDTVQKRQRAWCSGRSWDRATRLGRSSSPLHLPARPGSS